MWFSLRALIESPWVKALLVGLVVAIVGGFGFVSSQAFSTPVETTERVTRASYLQQGQFSPVLHLTPGTAHSPSAKEGRISSAIFMKLVDSIGLSYSYEFSPAESVEQVRVEVVAVVETPDLWRKELVLVPKAVHPGAFVVDFPLNLEDIKELIQAVEEEIGFRGASHKLTVVARVRTFATVEGKPMDEELVQTLEVPQWEGNTLEFGRDQSTTEVGAAGTTPYRHHGRFDYRVKLLPNTLFGQVTMTSRESSRSPVPVPPGSSQPIDSAEWAEVGFSYKFESEEPAVGFDGDVSVSALLHDPETKWSASLVSISDTMDGKEYTVALPVDLDRVTELIEAARTEHGPALAPKLTIEADAGISFEVDGESINEMFSQSVDVKLAGGTVQWGEKFVQTKQGSRTETVVTAHPEVLTRRLYSTAVAGVFGLVLLFIGGWYGVSVVRRILAERAMPARKLGKVEKKRKDVMVDIDEVPVLGAEDKVIRVSSLEDLARVSDTFFKPILRRPPTDSSEPQAYYVLDGSVRYEYLFFARRTPGWDEREEGSG